MPKVSHATVKRYGTELIVPEGMQTQEAITLLERKLASDEQVVNFSETFNAFPWDGAHALMQVLGNLFGFFLQGMTPGGFFSPDRPPEWRAIEVGPGKVIQVPWGRIFVPVIPEGDGYLQTFGKAKDDLLCFGLAATVKRKHLETVKTIAKLVAVELAERSIYRGKAIKMKFKGPDGRPLVDEDNVPTAEPKFLDVEGIDESNLVYTKEVEEALRINVWTPIEQFEALRSLGISGKRGILFAGPYGTGKTLAQLVTAQKGVKSGWTFVMVERADELAQGIQFARQYAGTTGAIVSCEDIDRATNGERSVSLDELLNTIDGIESKKSNIMVLLTTNHVEQIHPAMLRPGRLDAVIHILRPDAEAAERLVRLYAGKLLVEGADLKPAAEALAGTLPAVVAECVQRAKFAALSRGESVDKLQINGGDVLAAAGTMKMQLELLESKRKAKPTEMQVFAEIIGGHLAEGVSKAIAAAPTVVNLMPGSSNGASRKLPVANGLAKAAE